MTLAELQSLDAGYRFTPDDGVTFPWRDRGVRIPTLQAVYRSSRTGPINIEIKGERPGTEAAVWRTIEAVEGRARTLVVTDSGRLINRFRAASAGMVRDGSLHAGEFTIFRLLSLLRLSRCTRLPSRPCSHPTPTRGSGSSPGGLVRAGPQVRAPGRRVDDRR